MKLSFHGADRDVTGSCHLIECAGKRILIDCGMHQGSRELDAQNADPFGFDPKSLDLVLLTHAHLDHCGRLPLLVKQGYRGEIITTDATRELAQLVILDAAHLQEEDIERRSQMNRRRGNKPVVALYSLVDATNCLHRFGRAAEYGKPIEIVPGLRATFLDAGHILGSASILLEFEEQGKPRSVVFSGDLGNAGRPLLNPPAPPAKAEIVVMESTYGNRLHRPYAESVEEFYAAIIDTLNRGGNVLIPTFALERAQEILYLIRAGVESKRIRPAVQVFLDSPMAISATEIFAHHPESCAAAVAESIRQGHDPFQIPGLHLTRGRADSVAINAIRGGAIIMAGSGMCTGGRIRHHLRHNIWRAESTVVFVGYAAKGTLARQIIDGARSVKLFDEDIPVRSRIHTINGFSAHADQQELLDWRQHIQGVATTFLVHGEEQTMQELATKLPKGRIELPALHQTFDI
jgi:metallo-beta-lactamase family protein